LCSADRLNINNISAKKIKVLSIGSKDIERTQNFDFKTE
jgi:hypothetical protein